MTAIQDMHDWRLLNWLSGQQHQDATPRRWGANAGISESVARGEFELLREQRVVTSDERLGFVSYALSPTGHSRLAEMNQPHVQRTMRSAFCRDLWIRKLYEGGHTSVARRLSPSDLFDATEFSAVQLTPQDHAAALDYLEAKHLIETIGSAEVSHLLVYLTSTGQDCAESGGSVADYLRSQAQGFVQTYHFTNVGAAAAGRDHVSAVQMVNQVRLEDVRAAIREHLEGEERADGLVLLDDVEAAAQDSDSSKLQVRLRQLGQFGGRVAEKTVTSAIKAVVRAFLT